MEFLGNSSKYLKFLVDTDLGDTWLAHPKGEGSDTIGSWDSEKLKFNSKNHWVPEKFVNQHPRRVPLMFKDTETEEYFDVHFLYKPNSKINLPTGIFSPNSTYISDKNLHLFEHWGRMGTVECEVTQNMLDLNNDMLNSVIGVIEDLDLSNDNASNIVADVTTNLKNISLFNSLAMQSNYRSKTFAIQSSVKAKKELRSLILDKYEGDETAIEKLLCSSFFSKSIFGPISKSFTDAQPGCSGRKALLQAKASKGGYTKRKIQNNNNFQAKRGRFDFNKGRGGYKNKGDDFYSNNSGKYESKYATASLFPKGGQRGAKNHRGKRGFKR